MKKEIKKAPGIFPMPVLMIGTYNEDGTVDVMNAAWGMAQSMNNLKLCLTESHKTVKKRCCARRCCKRFGRFIKENSFNRWIILVEKIIFFLYN